MTSPDLSIVVPAFNEAVNLAAVIEDIVDTMNISGIDYELIIVNNGSTDGTAEAIRRLEIDNPRIRHIFFESNQGYGGGIRRGLDAARGAVLCWTHADGQADPTDIVRIYEGMKAAGFELGKAVRAHRLTSRWRNLQSGIWYAIFRLLYPMSYRDPNSTPRLLTSRARDVLKLGSDDWFLEPEFIIKSLRLGIPIYEVETVWRNRASGATRAHLFTGVEFLKNLLVYRFGIK